MKNRRLQAVALLLTYLLILPTPQLMALGQQAATPTAQEKPQEKPQDKPQEKPQDKPLAESPEEKKLREREESLRKKEEDRKSKEAKVRATEAKKYQTLSEFAEDLYASDPEFKDQVEDAYLDLQSRHASEAYQINISHSKELLTTENEGEVLKLRRSLYDNPRVQEYVNRLGQQIVPDDSEKLYAFKITVNPIPQAYTLSTGTVLISTGMISLLDNEAQLAYVLAHELAHVYKDHWRIKVMMPFAEAEYNRKQEKKRAMWAGILTLAGAGVGGAIGGGNGAGIGALVGLGAGLAVGSYYSRKIALDWNLAQENEADDFALKATLGKSFDIQEVPRLYANMAQVSRVDNRIQLGFLGMRSRIKERTDYAQRVIAGSLQAQYQEAVKANKVKGTSPEFNMIMSELKRDNGIEAFYFDMFQMAKMNLQQSIALRSDDPLTAYYYGRVMKQVGRTKEDLDLAQQSLLKAISLDIRHDIPEVQLHRALLLMDTKDSASNAEAVAALKIYITAYEQKRATSISNDGLLPPNVDVLYGYMRLLGEKTWTAPALAEILKTNSGNSNSPIAQPPASIPKIEPASVTLSPTNSRKARKP
ncbi:MAG TPA: M48 family metalloprotease [Pyrinomonadaceae bacterium]|nr:M48 family metalloprotease [Pyrinomonadaceae bacterium]